MTFSTTMDTLTKKTLLTTRGYTYTYYVAAPAHPTKPTLLLQHGFPDSAAEWADLITTHLVPAGYGVLAPDLLGYAGTAKPTDPAAYRMGALTADLVELLDAEGLAHVVSLGHDWGSRLAVMLYNLHPARVSGVVMVNVAYAGAARRPKFDLDGLLTQSEQAFGRGLLWYWKLFTAPDGAQLLRDRVDVLFDVAHAPQSWGQTFCTDGGMRRVLETAGQGEGQGEGGGIDLTTRPYATPQLKAAFVERFRRDGFEAPVCWYKSHVLGLQDDEPDPANAVIQVPSLFVGYTDDVVCRKEAILPVQAAGLLPRLTNVTLEGAHWGLLEDPEAFGRTVTGWLDETYS